MKNNGKEIMRFTWAHIENMVDDLKQRITRHNLETIYGIPRGGQIVAVLLSYRLNLPVVESQQINDSTLIVDDIEDSGNTITKYKKQYPNNIILALCTKIPKKTKAVFHICKIIGDKHVKFPWEVE